MNGIQILNGATDISSYIDWRSVDLTLVLTKEKGGLKFDMLVPDPTHPPPLPAFGDTFYLNYQGVEIFGGSCTEKEAVIDGGILQRYHITCMDWGFKFDSKLVHKTYQNMDPADIVEDIVANFAPAGFTTNNVQRGNFMIASMKFNYEQPTKAIEALAKQIGWDWYIDPQKDVHFFFATTATGSSEINPAPFNIDDTSGNVQFSTIDIDMSIANLKNSIFVIGGTMFRANNTSDTPDVYTTTSGKVIYTLGYPYDTTTISNVGAGDTLRVDIDGVAQSIGIDGQTDPGTVNVLYNNGSGGGAQGGAPFIRLTSDPGAGHTLKIYGNASVPIVAHLTNPSSITSYGELQDSIIDKQIKSVQEAQARAEAELIQFDHPVYDVKFNTLTPGLAIGQSIQLNSVKFGITNYPLIIRRIECIGYSPTELLYQVEALGSDNVTFTDMMLTLLQQQLALNATPDNTILQVVLPISEMLSVTDAVSIIPTSGPYVWGPTWPYQIPLTVAHGKVSGANVLTMPIYVDLSTLPAAFFSNVNSDGSDIRIYDAATGNECPVEVFSINTGAKTGELWFLGSVDPANDKTYNIVYGNPGATARAATHPMGQNAVWGNYSNVYHLGGNANDSVGGKNISSLIEVSQASDSLSFPGEIAEQTSLTGATAQPFGKATTYQKIAQSFQLSATVGAQLDILLRKVAATGSLSTSSNWAIQGDSGGSPNGTNIASGTFALNGTGQPPTTSDVIMISSGSLTGLATGTTYWLVLSMSSNSDTNYPNVAYDPSGAVGTFKYFNGSSWNTITGSLRHGIYKSGYAQISSNIAPAIQDMAVSFFLKKTDINYECVLGQNSVGQTSGHLEVNGAGGSFTPTKGMVTYRGVSGNPISITDSALDTSDGNYHRIDWIRDATSSRLYVDGAAAGTGGTDAVGTNRFEKLGPVENRLNSTYGTALKGNLKQVRFGAASALAHEADRIATEFNNQSSPATFYSLGAVAARSPQMRWSFFQWQ